MNIVLSRLYEYIAHTADKVVRSSVCLRWCCVAGSVAALLPTTYLPAQITDFKLMQSRSAVYGSSSRYGAAAHVADRVVATAAHAGVLITDDGGARWTATMDPDLAIRMPAKQVVFSLGGQNALASGQAGTLEASTMRTLDGGETWEYFWDRGLLVANGVTFPGDGFGKVYEGNGFDSYTSDAGLTWKTIYRPDSVYGRQDVPFQYFGGGQFAIRDRDTKRWYTVKVDEALYDTASIPYEMVQILPLPSGDLLGYTYYFGASTFYQHTFYRRKQGESAFVKVTFRDEKGRDLDTFYINSFTQTSDGSVIAICRRTYLENDELLLVITDDSTFAIRCSDLDTNAVSWSRVECSHDGRFLATTNHREGGYSSLVIVDVAEQSARIIQPRGTGSDLAGWSFDPDFMNDSTACEIDGDGGVRILNLRTGVVTLGGTVHDDYDRFATIRIDALVSGGRALHSLDMLGTISTIQHDTVAVLRGWRTALNQYDGVTPTVTMSLGTGHVWPRDSTILSGGPHLLELRDTVAHTVLRSDTTTFWTRLDNGTELAGYREMTRRLKGADQFDTIATISDGRAVIGAMLQVSQDTILAALRGYVHTIFEGATGSEPDTIPGGLWRSIDDGVTWERIALPANAEMILSLQQRPSDGSVWISMRPVHRESIVETDADGKQTIVQENLTMGEISLLRSADAGASWDVVHSQSYNGSYQPSTSNVAFQGANTVVWATHDRVHWSDDNGSSWRLIDGIPGLTTIVGSVAFDTAGALWAATSEGLFKANAVNVSVDEGNIDEVHDPRSHSTPIFWANTFPNPTDRTFTLRLYNLDRLRGDVEQFEIVDLLGRTVLDLSYLTQGQRPQGTIDVPLDLGVNASGLYLLVARTAQRSFTWPMWVYRE